MRRPAAVAAPILTLLCIVALVLPAAGGARDVGSMETTLSVYQDAKSTVPANATTLGEDHLAASLSDRSEKTGWQRASDVFNFHMRVAAWLLKYSPIAFMWLGRAAAWLLVAFLVYFVMPLLVIIALMLLWEAVVAAYVCCTHGGWDREAYNQRSPWVQAERYNEAQEKAKKAKEEASKREAPSAPEP